MEGFIPYLIWLLPMCVVFALYTSYVSKKSLGKDKSNATLFLGVILAALLVRIVIAVLVPGFKSDMGCWRGWAGRLADGGPRNFYSPDYFCDYPPGYLYILNFLGLFREHIMPNASEATLQLLFKLPAILFDLATTYIIYLIAKKSFAHEKVAVFSAAVYAFCPPVILNSAAWGQVDAVFTFFTILAVYFLLEHKLIPSSILLGIAILCKPQALMYGPVFLFYFLDKRNFKDIKERLINLVMCLVIGVSVIIIGSMPFMGFDIKAIANLYLGTLSSYNYASVNAFNIYALFGQNWARLENNPRMFYMPAGVFGSISMAVSVLIGGFLFLKAKVEDKSRYFYIAAMIMLMLFTFGVKMHERYLFGVIAMLLIAFCLRRDKRILALAFVVSLQHYINAAYILILEPGTALPVDDVYMGLSSLLCVVMCLYSIYLGYRLYNPKTAPYTAPLALGNESQFQKKAAIILCVITLLYTGFAYFNLGNIKAAQNGWTSVKGQSVVFELDSPGKVTRLMTYNGLGSGVISIEASNDRREWNTVGSIDKTSAQRYCYTWYSVDINCPDARYLRITPSEDNINMIELGFYENDTLLSGKALTDFGQELFDEQSLVPTGKSYMHSMYFDEIYHGRTAYELNEGISPYEWTHPPLGKELIGIGISIFGMTPFGWRFMGTLFGALMIPLMYAFAKKLFARTDLAFVAALLTMFDFMHFEHSRISSIDIYVVFFIVLAYYFMYDFFTLDLRKEKLSRICRPLLLSGMSWGCACAVKWAGIYAGAGLAIIFFWALLSQGKKAGKRYTDKAYKICFLCVLFFGVIPFAIYYLTFVPILRIEGSYSFFEWQQKIWNYHSDLEATHSYSSTYWQWPILYKPLWMYSNRGDGTTSTMSAFGNPAIWYAATASVAFIITLVCRKVKDNRLGFLLIAFASQIVPWIAVTRCTFIYHFFESIPFLTLMLCYVIGMLLTRHKKHYLYIYLGIVILLFVLYYPVLSGWIVPKTYSDSLKMFESWVF